MVSLNCGKRKKFKGRHYFFFQYYLHFRAGMGGQAFSQAG